MTHWENRPEKNWKKFRFNQPYAKGLKRLKEEVLAKTDFDPAVLWQWGAMQARGVIEILKACERAFGKQGQEVVCEAIRKVGYDVGRQALEGIKQDEELTEADLVSFFGTAMNRIAYASLEAPAIDAQDRVSFDILWCPHQDIYGPFDCRVQRYFVQGMIDAAKDIAIRDGWQMKFTEIIPAGAEKCRFQIWRATDQEKSEWERYSAKLDAKALEMSENKE